MNSRRFVLGAAAAALTAFSAFASVTHASEKLSVITTFSILQDMVTRVGGEQVTATTLVGANGDAHVYQPTPADARAINSAEVLIINGLEFEGWLERLIEAAAFKGKMVVATNGVEPISFGNTQGGGHGAFDPHAWQSIDAAIIYVNNISAALTQAKPENAGYFEQNRSAYVAELKALDAEINAMFVGLSESQRTIITSHDAFGYFAQAYDISFEAPVGVGTETEASAADIAALITQIRDENISAIFVESIVDDRLVKQIARETGAAIGGTLYSDALSEANGPAGTYIAMMRHNAKMISKALCE